MKKGRCAVAGEFSHGDYYKGNFCKLLANYA